MARFAARHKHRRGRTGQRWWWLLAVLVLAGVLVAQPGVRSSLGLRRAPPTGVGHTAVRPNPSAPAARQPPVVQVRARRARQPATFRGPDGVEAAWVVAENKRPGTTAWRIPKAHDGGIAGFADRTSAAVGDKVTIYVSTAAAGFRVEAFRMGYYDGDGARLVWTSPLMPGRSQPTCPVARATNMVSCDNWSPSLRFTVTAAFVQGDYLLKLVGTGDQQSYVPLTITDPSSHATYLVKNDVFTWQAWNPYGGYDFYGGLGTCPADEYPPCNRADVVSFDRPYAYGEGAADFLGNEYPLVRFAEEHGLDVTYVTDTDVELDPAILRAHTTVLSLGHDECWALDERIGAEAAERHGVNIVFFGASPVLRHVRMQASPLGPAREEVDYRDSAEDPLDGRGNPLLVTGNTWATPPTDWSEVPFVGEGYSGYLLPGAPAAPLVVVDASAWIYKGTGLRDGSEVPAVLVSDFDQVDPDLHPADLQILAHSPIPPQDSQSSVSVPYSDMTYYTDPNGGGVFDTGTVAWIPDLSSSPVLQRMTGNLLALFGRGPASRIRPSVANWSRFYP